jgi:hypothetical protein
MQSPLTTKIKRCSGGEEKKKQPTKAQQLQKTMGKKLQ